VRLRWDRRGLASLRLREFGGSGLSPPTRPRRPRTDRGPHQVWVDPTARRQTQLVGGKNRPPSRIDPSSMAESVCDDTKRLVGGNAKHESIVEGRPTTTSRGPAQSDSMSRTPIGLRLESVVARLAPGHRVETDVVTRVTGFPFTDV
jgi:hypothetical protein